MKVLTISGSLREDSKNIELVKSLSSRFSNINFEYFDIATLPLFMDNGEGIQYPEQVNKWRVALSNSDALIISTPEYIFNIPAALKNALEWITQSGELHEKKVLPITFMPAQPRGEKAMQSLTWSLQALECRIVGQLDLYQTDLIIENGIIKGAESALELLDESIQLLLD